MKKIVILSLTCIAMLIVVACKKDFIVQDISKKSITVNAPANNTVTSSNAITFWWELLDGAEQYNIQLVKPNFNNIVTLVTDTNVTSNKLNLTLQPGDYQWRIRAFNAGHTTAYQVFTLKIDSSGNLTNQLILPISPLNGFLTRNKQLNFSWNPLSSATSYSVEISLNNSVVNYSVVNTSNYTYSFNVTSAANYTCSWRVRAINANSISQYNSPQTFTLDLLPPTAVSSPTYPASNPIIKDTTELRWIKASDTQYDSLFIYTDAAFVNLVRTTTVSVNKLKINLINTSNPLPAGTTSATAIPYWWRLKSVDNVGNTTGFSSAFNFQLIQ